MKNLKVKLTKRLTILGFFVLIVITGGILIENKFKTQVTGFLDTNFPLLLSNKFCEDSLNQTQQNCFEFIPAAAANQHIASPYQSISGAVQIDGYNVAGFVAQADQNADVIATGQTWVDIPGASYTLTLPPNTTKTVNLRAFGSVQGRNGTNYNYTHCGFRFLVNGSTSYDSALHSSWGDQIVAVTKWPGTTIPTTGPGWWIPWYIERDITNLTTGSHTIKVQVTGWSVSDVGCNVSNNSYSRARLRIEAR